MAIGSFDFGLTMCGINPSASSEPSIKTSLGRTRSSNCRKCHAAAGERWRTPKMCGEDAGIGLTRGVNREWTRKTNPKYEGRNPKQIPEKAELETKYLHAASWRASVANALARAFGVRW